MTPEQKKIIQRYKKFKEEIMKEDGIKLRLKT